MLRALFYYVLGGITFLPLCLVAGFLYFILTCPPVEQDGQPLRASKAAEGAPGPLGDVDLSPERKAEALDLAVAAAANASSAAGTEESNTAYGADTAVVGGVDIPTAAKRLLPLRTDKPGTSASAAAPVSSKNFRSGWLIVRKQFHPPGSAEAVPHSTHTEGISDVGDGGSSTGGAAGDSGSLGKSKGGYMSAVYRGLLDYRKNQAGGNQMNGQSGSDPEAEQQAPSNNLPGGLEALKSDGNTKNGKPDRAGVGRNQAAKEQFHAILKGPILYLYSADESSPNATNEVQAAIDVRGKRVSIYIAGLGDVQGEPSEEGFESMKLGNGSSATVDSGGDGSLDQDPDASAVAAAATTTEEAEAAAAALAKAKRHEAVVAKWKAVAANVRDGELFMKRNAVRIVGKLPPALSTKLTKGHVKALDFTEWFIFAKSATLLEDWYHALLHASLLPLPDHSAPGAWKGADKSNMAPFQATTDPVGPLFSTMDMSALLASLDTVPDPIPLRWLNAMLGRVFFSIYRTAWLEDYVTNKLMKKISRVKTPSFLSDVRVREVDLGRTPPAFSRPMLKSLTGEGEASMEVTLHYTGSLRLTISTNLTISLGSRFKSYTVSLLLAVVLRSLEGNLLLHIKPPPSNRLWFGFTQPPKMDLAIEPVVSERKVQWSMVTRIIESRIREMMMESLVLPHMDDVPFFDTRPMTQRGGLWADAVKRADQTASSSFMFATPSCDSSKSQSRRPSAPHAPPVPEGAASSEAEDGISSSVNVSAAAADDELAPRIHQCRQIPPGPPALPTSASASLNSLLSRDAAAAAASGAQQLQAMSIGSDSQIGTGPGSTGKRKTWFASSSRLAVPSGFTSASVSASRKTSQNASQLSGGTYSGNLPSSSNAPPLPEQVEAAHDTSDTGASSVKSMPIQRTFTQGTQGAIEQGSRESSLILNDWDPSTAADVPNIQRTTSSAQMDAVASAVEPQEDELVPIIPPRPQQATELSYGQINKKCDISDQERTSPASAPSQHGHTASFAWNGPSVILTPAQQARYDAARLSQRTQSLNVGALAGQNVSGALLSSWNKARASLADKESRTAAAKDAKDAMKRGWASFQSRRMDGKNNALSAVNANVTAVNQTLHERGLMMSSGRSETYSTSSEPLNNWLASSPPDPVSMAIGIDTNKPERGSTKRNKQAEADESFRGDSQHYPRTAVIRDEERGGRDADRSVSASSSRSSSVSKQSYREHRAERASNTVTPTTSEAPKAPSPVTAVHQRTGSSTSQDVHTGSPPARAFIPAAPIATTSVASGIAVEFAKSNDKASAISRSVKTITVEADQSPRTKEASGSGQKPSLPLKGIKVQPKPSAMMAIPGMSAGAKAEPQSFSASPPLGTKREPVESLESRLFPLPAENFSPSDGPTQSAVGQPDAMVVSEPGVSTPSAASERSLTEGERTEIVQPASGAIEVQPRSQVAILVAPQTAVNQVKMTFEDDAKRKVVATAVSKDGLISGEHGADNDIRAASGMEKDVTPSIEAPSDPQQPLIDFVTDGDPWQLDDPAAQWFGYPALKANAPNVS
ncbi:hypothetical protein K437DRAFT_172694 [Tilletiaria anomala UBC 951]|uniref:SMP-LTD domain-containing protein n=1 Tax=Tilletiaria anomala (strain ATCC 24038 / CBS 436.72 / UBC 951) TaxID=1037660 RepID=A0A066VJ46_TILAU|nr:uncharacterized protein K437DRAFT_172694 [Tilletiaria anomala UBC 951]KDN41516.1 hypothetical protein K437DRAFT_172694 [Tilletiaria anomala UBC 951]